MRLDLSIAGYFDNRGGAHHGTEGREPMVHIFGYDRDGTDLQSLSFDPAFAPVICQMITDAAHAAMNDPKGYHKKLCISLRDKEEADDASA